MGEKRAPTQNTFGSSKGPGADPLGVGANMQKTKEALFKIDKAPCVKKGFGHRTPSEAF